MCNTDFYCPGTGNNMQEGGGWLRVKVIAYKIVNIHLIIAHCFSQTTWLRFS